MIEYRNGKPVYIETVPDPRLDYKPDDGVNKIFGQLFENLKTPQAAPAPYPFRTILASSILIFVHDPLVFFGTVLVMLMLWNWFLPLVGIATITYPIALGIYMLIRLVIWKKSGSSDQSEMMTKALLQTPLATTLMFFVLSAFRLGLPLGLGYLIHLFA